MNLPLVPSDKGTHFIVGTILATIAKALFPEIPYIGLVIAGIAGVLKEGVDAIGVYLEQKAGKPVTHSVEFLDFVATLLGGVSTLV